MAYTHARTPFPSDSFPGMVGQVTGGNPKTTGIYPHQYLKVNTIFEVAHGRGWRTAWSDKHAAYEILSGPSGQGIDDLFAP